MTDSITIPAPVLRWLCVNIMATQRAIQNAGYISEARMQREIDAAEWEYDAEAEKQKQARKAEAAAMSVEGQVRLEGNPFLTSLREFAGVKPDGLGADRLKNIDEYLKTVESNRKA